MIRLFLLIIAMVLFILASLGVPSTKINLGWLGCFFFAASFLPLGG